MKILLLSILLLQYTQISECNIIEFLDDYTSTKNIKVILHSCWIKDANKELAKISSKKCLSISKNLTEVSTFHNNIVIMDINNCESVWKLLFEVNRTGLFRFPRKYLILIDDITKIEVFLRNFTIYPSSDVTIAERNGSNIRLHQVYRINMDSGLIWERYGSWSPKHGLNIYLKKVASERRHNFRQEKLKLMLRITDPDTWHHLEDFRYPRIDAFYKKSYGSTKSLLDYLNVKVVNTSTEYVGYRNETTGEFNGVVGALARSEVELSGTPVLITVDRLEHVEFLSYLAPNGIRFILKKPPLSYVKNIFVLALNKTVWISLALLLSIFGISFYFVLNTEAKKQKINNQKKYTATDVSLISLEAVCQQGTTTDPARVSSRILTLVFFLALMFIFEAYSANIVGMLQLQVELKSQKELLDSKFDVGIEENNYIREFISQSKDEVSQQLYKERIGKTGFYEMEDGMEKVRKGFFAYHIEMTTAYNYILNQFTNYEICSLQEMEGYLQHLVAYTATRRNSPYKEILKAGSLKVNEYGLTNRNFKRICIKPACHAKGAAFESVGLIETRLAFQLLGYGTILASVILLVENIAHYFQNQN